MPEGGAPKGAPPFLSARMETFIWPHENFRTAVQKLAVTRACSSAVADICTNGDVICINVDGNYTNVDDGRTFHQGKLNFSPACIQLSIRATLTICHKKTAKP